MPRRNRAPLAPTPSLRGEGELIVHPPALTRPKPPLAILVRPEGRIRSHP